MLPATSSRIYNHTSDAVNQEIREKTEKNIADYASKGAIAINKRLAELDREWDIERTLEANAATISLIGLGMGTFVNKKWYILPAVVAGFLLQHALQGWCPPLPVFRRQGIRTADEIETEKYALKLLRGDFEELYEKKSYQRVDYKKAIEAVTA